MGKSDIEIRLQQAVLSRKAANMEYTAVVEEAYQSGMTNQRIADIAGVSETAIRMYRKRHNKPTQTKK